MAFNDVDIKCGQMIVYNSFLYRNRKAFCIDVCDSESVVYKGWFGLKIIPKRLFLKLFRVVDVCDVVWLFSSDGFKLKRYFIKNEKSLLKSKTVEDFVKKLYELSGISMGVCK